MMLVRQIRRIAGNPRIRLRLRPAHDYGRHRGGHHLRQQPHPLRRQRPGPAADHRRVDHRHPRGERRSFWTTPSRCCSGRTRRCRARVAEVGRHFFEETAAYWREWVRLAGDPVRMAGRGDPRRHHAQAQRVRGHRRDRRRHDDVDSRSAAQRPQLGLPLLLAARRLFRGQRAQPARRDPHDGALSGLHPQHRGRGRQRTPAAGVRHQRRVGYAPSGRSTRCPAIAAWDRCGSATRPTSRCSTTCTASAILAATHVFFDRRLVRRGDEALFHRLEALGEQRRERSSTSPTPASGSCAAWRGCTRPPA